VRRALVVTDDCARHPFRTSLPPHVCRGGKLVPIPGRQMRALPDEAPIPARKTKIRLTTQDLTDFLLAYSACFIAVSAYIN